MRLAALTAGGMVPYPLGRSKAHPPGERGVCYEIYALGRRPGSSFIFEQGRYDDFSPEDVALFLTITGEVCAAVADYQFTNVTQLSRDFTQGRFAAAFPPQPSAPPCTDLLRQRRSVERAEWPTPPSSRPSGAREDAGQRDYLAWPGMSSHEGASAS